ncbi:MAG: aminotransferase class IV [Alphaproteobacteria bacterium]|nr:aminotransferase class IV [Alphaproteobacteria bacterium]
MDFSDGIAFTDGQYVPIAEARISMLDWGFLRSDANQDTVTVWNGAFFRLDDHMARFARNIAKLRMTGPYTQEERREIVIDCVRKSGLREAYVQMIMTRGNPPIGSRDLRLAENRFHVFCIPYVWIAPPEKKREGLHLHLSERQRVPPESVDPTLKHYHWLEFEMGLFEAYDAGAETVVLSDGQGNVTEGPGFNVFAVKDGALVTPERGVLDGMTRRTVFELCEEIGVAYAREPLPADALRQADEVFLTTSGGGLIPITQIDNTPVGNGHPGILTTRIDELYWSKREAGWLATPVEY